MTQVQYLREIVGQLRDLQRTSPAVVADLPAWEASAREFTRQLHTKYPDIDLPIQVMHYLHDGDVRIKDPEFRLTQDEMLNGIIADLERGAIPPSMGVTVPFHPRWLGAAALVVLAAICWIIVR